LRGIGCSQPTYAGAHRSGAEVFEPETCRVLMAAVLVHDPCARPRTGRPRQDEAFAAAHGGLWQYLAAVAIVGLALLPGRRSSPVICGLVAAYFAWIGIAYFAWLMPGMHFPCCGPPSSHSRPRCWCSPAWCAATW